MADGVVGAGIAINKLLLFAPPEDFASIREDAENMFEGDCAITTAGPSHMLLAKPAEGRRKPARVATAFSGLKPT